MLYIYKRNDHLVDALIRRHLWVKVTVNDTGTTSGSYVLGVLGSVFVADDVAPGVDDSAALAASLLAQVNASSVPVTAIAGALPNEVLLRFDNFEQGGHPVTQGVRQYTTYTTDAEGSILSAPVMPTYTVRAATNWDAVFAPIETVPVYGKRSAKYRPSHMLALNPARWSEEKYARFLFDPVDYGLTDSNVLFLQVVETVEGQTYTSQVQMVMTPEQYRDNQPALLLVGTAPGVAINLRLPRQATSIVAKNTGGTALYLGFGSGAAEWSIPAGGEFRDNNLNVGHITLRGSTTCQVYVALTPRYSI